MGTGYHPRERAVEAARLLNYFLVDLVIGTRSLEIFENPAIVPHVSSGMMIGLNRMALSHLMVTLAKWAELYKRYAAILPTDVRGASQELNQDIQARGIVNFRNEVVGHILDNSTRRPLTSREIDERLERIMAGERADFFRWINDPAGNTFPMSVVAITEHVRDRLRAEYSLQDQEIL